MATDNYAGHYSVQAGEGELPRFTVIRANELERFAGPGDMDEHRKGPPPLSYRLREITGGRGRAMLGTSQPVQPVSYEDTDEVRDWESGTHYHPVELQLAFIMGGSIEIANYEDQWSRKAVPEILVIPGYAPHNAARMTSAYRLVEMSFLSDFGTVPCSPTPEGEKTLCFEVGDTHVRPAGTPGVADYILQPHVAEKTRMRLITAGDGPVDTPDGDRTYTLVRSGTCDIEFEGERSTLGIYDMAVDSVREGRSRLLNRSSDFVAYQVIRA
jgi:hypothetical protein